MSHRAGLQGLSLDLRRSGLAKKETKVSKRSNDDVLCEDPRLRRRIPCARWKRYLMGCSFWSVRCDERSDQKFDLTRHRVSMRVWVDDN